MLKVSARPQFKQKITASVPIDGGSRDEVFFVTYRLASEPDKDMSSPARQDDFVRDIVVELHDVADETGKAVPHSDELLSSVLALPWAKLAIIRGYFAAITGARAGN
jgi:hypothetical protein